MQKPPLSSKMDIQQILQYLPHRYPFIMLDRVIDFYQPEDPEQIVGRKIKCIKNVTINEPFFNGHFPHRPVMPGVLQLEAMAQCMALACYSPSSDDYDVLMVGVENAKFRRMVVPGDVLVFECEVMKYRTKLAVVKCSAFVEGELISEATIKAALG